MHGLFLNAFFPIINDSPVGKSPGGTAELFVLTAATAAGRYWPFVLFSAVSRIPDFRHAFESRGGPNMLMPYAQVIRMHLMIFVFAGLHAAGLQHYAVYPILVFYFFPVKPVLGAALKRRKEKPSVMRVRGS